MEAVADRSRTIVSWFVEMTSRARARSTPLLGPISPAATWPSRLKSPAGAAEPEAKVRKERASGFVLAPLHWTPGSGRHVPQVGSTGHRRARRVSLTASAWVSPPHPQLGMNSTVFYILNTKTKTKVVKPDTKTNINLRNIKNFENELIRAELYQTRSVYEKSIRNIGP